jgi:hypothetical protein
MPLAIYIGFEIDLRVALSLAALLLVKAALRQRVEIRL